jgi:hypothetical protein
VSQINSGSYDYTVHYLNSKNADEEPKGRSLSEPIGLRKRQRLIEEEVERVERIAA